MPALPRFLDFARHATAEHMKRILRLPAIQPALAWLVGSYLLIALRTTRWDVHGRNHLAPFAAGRVVIAAFWHERLTLMPMLWMQAQVMQPTKAANIHMLVSRHRDGRLIGSVLRRFGVQVVHGSSSEGAMTAMRRTMALLKNGQQIAILLSSDIPTAHSAKLGSDGSAAAVRSRRTGVRAPHSRPAAGLGSIALHDRGRDDGGGGMC